MTPNPRPPATNATTPAPHDGVPAKDLPGRTHSSHTQTNPGGVGGKLRVTPCTITEAREFVRLHHRHHRPPVSGLFAVAVADTEVRGVAIVGRPVSRVLDSDDYTAEVTRVCTDGAQNACSMLYAACWRAARSLGYRRLVTYALTTEPGTSVTAAGWREVARTKADGWDTPSRPRVDLHPLQAKIRWERTA